VLFNSFEFLLAFLPVTLLVFAFLARVSAKASKVWLVMASLFFYGWWNPPYLVLLGISICGNYVLGSFLFRAPAGRAKRVWLGVGIALNLAALGYFKYANFFVDTVNAVSGTHLILAKIALPLAISFFTFTEIVFLLEVSKNPDHYYSFLDYAFFVTFFPHLIAGPIVRHWEVMPQLENHRLGVRAHDLVVGLFIFVIGLSKKVMLADAVADYSTLFFAGASKAEAFTSADAWLAALAYGLQLYFDFSGYSDMAIGLARMFGIRFPVNFNSPYKATSIADFWRRWHITLTRFFREYVYFSLGGNRLGPFRQIFNVVVTMLLSGLWHGANWTFVVWGGIHGACLAVNHFWQKLGWELRSGFGRRAQDVAAWGLTMVFVLAGWVCFRASSLPVAGAVLKEMFSIRHFTISESLPGSHLLAKLPFLHFGASLVAYHTVTEFAVIALLTVLALFAPNTQQLLARYEPTLEQISASPAHFQLRLDGITSAAVGITLGLCLLCMNKVSEFLYYKF
jgi:alginate O-acetyltransferase complex protein AlgI